MTSLSNLPNLEAFFCVTEVVYPLPLQILNSEVQTMLLVFGYWFNSNIVVSWYIFFCNFMILELKNNRLHLLKTERKIGSSVISFKMFFFIIISGLPRPSSTWVTSASSLLSTWPKSKRKRKAKMSRGKTPSFNLDGRWSTSSGSQWNRVMALHEYQYI